MSDGVLRVVRGDPTPEELAVLAALAAAPGRSDEQVPRPRRGAWNDPSAGLRRPLHPGPGGWRASAHGSF